MFFLRWVVLCFSVAAACLCVAQAPPPTATNTQNSHGPAPQTVRRGAAPQGRSSNLSLSISDENGVAVPAALITLVSAQTGATLRATSDYAGRVRFFNLAAGSYNLHAEKKGFYIVDVTGIAVPTTQALEAALTHEREYKEVVNVTAAPPAGIEPAQTASTSTMDAAEVVNVPYPNTRDIRSILPFIPGVVEDNNGRFHIDGSADYQNLDLLDEFNITSPVNGSLDMRFSADAVRGIDIQRSRISVEHGRETGGVMAFTTGMGDDTFRVSATNFLPSVQNRKGLNFDKFVPRATFSGPIVRRKAWFFLAPEFEYDQDIVKELPAGQDRNYPIRGSGLAKVQVNLSSRNILTGSFLINRLHSQYSGLSQTQPLPTTINLDQSAYLAGIKDQHYFQSGALLEVGLANVQFSDLQRPNGPNALSVTPEAFGGNFFRALHAQSRRTQGLMNLYLPPVQRWGKHEFLVGTDNDRIAYSQDANRRPIFIYRENRTLQRQTTFSPTSPWQKYNTEVGAYAQDRWTPIKPVLVELGVRYDWDEIVRQSVLAPRLAANWMITPNTKVSAGVGVFYDKTPLNFIAQPLDGQRFDTIFAQDGVTPLGPPLVTTFTVNQSILRTPRFLNSSIAVERKLPWNVYLRGEYIRKRSNNGFVFVNTTNAALGGDFLLTNTRHDRFDSFQITARKAFKEQYEVMLAYTRSAARSNQVFDFTIDNPVFSQQGAGPYPWDTPNRLLSYGWAPLPFTKHWSFAWAADVRSGFAFSAVNENLQVVGKPNSYRFPAYVSIDPFLEYRFTFRNRNLALRGGVANITGNENPFSVNNNIDSPQFLTFTGTGHRSFTVRIRFLGHK